MGAAGVPGCGKGLSDRYDIDGWLRAASAATRRRPSPSRKTPRVLSPRQARQGALDPLIACGPISPSRVRYVKCKPSRHSPRSHAATEPPLPNQLACA